MKNIFLIFLLLLCNTVGAQTTWTESFRLENNLSISPRDVIIHVDEKIIVCGFHDGGWPTGSRTVFLLSADLLTGDSLTLDNCTSGVPCNLREDVLVVGQNESGEIFTSGNQSFGSGDYLAKLSNSNDLSLSWKLEDLDQDSVNMIDQIETVSDGVIISGSYSGIDYFVMKFNFEGERIWSTRLPHISYAYQTIMTVLPNENIAIVNRESLSSSTTYLSLVDPSGKIIFRERSRMPIVALGFNNANEVTAIMRSTLEGNPYFLGKYTEEGEEIVLNFDVEITSARRIFSNQEDEFYIVGVDNTNGQKFTINKLSSDGTVLWNQSYSEEGYRYTYVESDYSDNGVLVIMGERSNLNGPASPEVVLVAVNVSEISFSEEVTNESKRVLVYPNPSKNEINIRPANLSDEQLESYELFTIDGRRVKGGKLSANESITLDMLRDGIYILKLINIKGEVLALESVLKY